MPDKRISSFRATSQHLFAPLSRDCFLPIYSTKESPSNGGVGVGVSTMHDGIDYSFLKAWRMKKLPQCILERYENPALLMNVVRRRSLGCISDCLHQRGFYSHGYRPRLDLVIQFLRPLPCSDGVGDSHGEQRVGLNAY